ncbi:MAG TPA: UxaA family hydrolase [Thermosynergistes sp.]|nr:UxaA family hydrolase [Thermosynergistes sp.]
MKIMGYVRPNGAVGIRNHLLVLPSVVCANDAARKIAEQLAGAVWVDHQHGCAELAPDAEQTRRTLAGFASNPNVGACIIVGLGCEVVNAHGLAEAVAKTGKPVECFVIQEVGGTVNTVAAAVKAGSRMLEMLSKQEREECDLSSITLALECGGSDACSGIAANPAVGAASDMLVEQGGTSILSETQELIGAEHLLAKRAVSPEVAERIWYICKRAEEGALKMGVDIRYTNPAPGNIEGGITTLEEKSLGCIHKAGHTPIQEVVEYAEAPKKKGLVIMDTPGHDVESITGMVAGGAQVVVFTTGRGTPVGCPIAPVIKVASNTTMYERMRDNMDINAGEIVDGEKSIRDVGKEIFDEIIAVCNGKKTKAEVLGFGSFAVNRIGPTQ